MAIEISEDYYLINFEQLVQFVSVSYADLLSPEELAFYTDFTALPDNARRLYIRLLCRTRNDFRVDKLSYPEIEHMDEAINALQSAGFLGVNELLNVDSAQLKDQSERWLPLFTKPELLSIATLDPGLRQFKSKRREALESYLIEEADPQVLRHIVSGVTQLTVKRSEVFLVYRLCFFGNLYQDMTDFVLRDLGLMVFEDYAMTPDSRAFQSRHQIEAHLRYYVLLEESEAVLEGDSAVIEAWCDELSRQLPTQQPILQPTQQVSQSVSQPVSQPEGTLGFQEGRGVDQTLKRRVDRLRNRMARQLERLDAPHSALNIYQQSDCPPARERRARLYAGLEQFDDALRVCADMADSPLTDAESEFAQEFKVRVLRRTGKKPEQPVKHQPVTNTIVLPHPATQVHDEDGRTPTVEQLSAQYFCQYGTCLYTENTLLTAVTGMVFWDCVFAPIPGAFYNPFQVGPADFSDPGFYRRRQSLIEDRLTSLNTMEDVVLQVERCLAAKMGRVNPLVQWRYLSDELLSNALNTIPLEHWIAVFRRILKDPKHNRSGLPDLILFPEDGGYCLIEVKGPGDRLQKNQVSWMSYFGQHDIPHQVCHVVWEDVTEPNDSADSTSGDLSGSVSGGRAGNSSGNLSGGSSGGLPNTVTERIDG